MPWGKSHIACVHISNMILGQMLPWNIAQLLKLMSSIISYTHTYTQTHNTLVYAIREDQTSSSYQDYCWDVGIKKKQTVSFQCMTKSTTIKKNNNYKKKKKKTKWK